MQKSRKPRLTWVLESSSPKGDERARKKAERARAYRKRKAAEKPKYVKGSTVWNRPSGLTYSKGPDGYKYKNQIKIGLGAVGVGDIVYYYGKQRRVQRIEGDMLLLTGFATFTEKAKVGRSV